MKTKILLLFIGLTFFSKINGQTKFCASSSIHAKKIKKDHIYKKKHADIEDKAFQFLLNKNQLQSRTAKYELPVVVHIIHENGSENISDTQVENAISHLNSAFENIGYYDQQTGVNTEISFCLAQQDPDGFLTTGINRVQSSLTTFNYTSQDIAMKSLSRWEPLEYINIYVVKEICSLNGCGVAGYAYFPSSHGQPNDGIVLESEYMGSSEAQSSVLVHEMGHYLGLYHTFQDGCPNSNCMTNGDRVCDTPPDNTTARVPCSDPSNSCNTDANSGFASDQLDMINNYMDYSNLECYNAFTQGQTDRMHFFIENERFSLLDSKGCAEPCNIPITALFSPQNDITINAGETVNFTNNSINAINYNWTIDGQSVSTNSNFSYQFENVGTFEVTLNASNNFANCRERSYTILVTVICSVNADFSSTSLFANIGETITFNNLSQNATDYVWSVNGNIEGNATDFSYSSATAGIYQVCLEASNQYCSDTNCTWVEFEADLEDCEKVQISIFGNDNSNELSTTLIAAPNGNLIASGRIDGKIFISELTNNLELLWTKEFEMTPFANEGAEKIFIDSDGFLIGCGSGLSSLQNTQSFVFKFDLNTQNMVWSTLSDQNLGILFYDIIENPSTGTYFLSGQNYSNSCQGILLEVDKNSGNLLNTPQEFNTGSCDTYGQIKFFNNGIIATGRFTFGGTLDKMRPILSYFNNSGNLIWSKNYLKNQTDFGRLYARDFFTDGNDIYTQQFGDFNGTSSNNYDCFLTKTNENGEIEFSKRYQFQNISFFGFRIFKTQNEIIMTGFDTRDSKFIVIKTDLLGNFLWAFKILESDVLNIRGNHGFTAGNNIYLTVGFDQADDDFIILKIPSGSKPEFDGCLDVEFLNPAVTDIPFVEENFNITTQNFSFQNTTQSPTLSNINFEEEIICQPPCQEICDNGIDDDEDGLIDCFDPDCDCIECEEHYYSSECADSCNIEIQAPEFSLKEAWSGTDNLTIVRTPIVGDLDGDGVPEIIATGVSGDLNTGYMATEVFIYSGDGSNRSNPAKINITVSGNGGTPLLADLNSDGLGELVLLDERQNLRIFSNYNGSSMTEWNISASTNISVRGAPNAADFNNDGIPEIYIGNEIFGFNHNFTTFSKLLNGTGAIGRREYPDRYILPIAPIAADVLSRADCNGDPDCDGLELICGPEVYSIDLKLSDGDGFEMKLQKNADDFSGGFDMEDGSAGVADMNLDGSLDIIIHGGWSRDGNKENGTYIYNPSKEIIYLKSESPSYSTANGSLGKVSIGNVYDDRDNGFTENFPEVIAVASNVLYTINLNQATISGTNGHWWSLPINDASAITGATCFDFNGDGNSEIVYRDEEDFRIIYGGAAPFPVGVNSERNWTKIPGGSRTGLEHPLVVDVDGDNATEIVLISGGSRALSGTLKVYESNGTPWIPSRPVWNQQQYYNVNVNDDLTIPANQQAHHLVGTEQDLNIFLAQYGNLDFPATDANIEVDTSFCNGDSLTVSLKICNEGSQILPGYTPITVYSSNPETTAASVVATFDLSIVLQPGECYEFEKNLKLNQSGTFFILVNADNSLSPPFDLGTDFPITNIYECNYLNNIASFDGLETGILTMELPADTIVCPNEAFTIYANSSTNKYKWQDGSIEPSYTIYEEGIYWCCIEDQCGNMACDSMSVEYDDEIGIDLGPDQQICEGDSLEIKADIGVADKIRWYPKNDVSCDTCDLNTVFPTVKTIYVVVGQSDLGCITVDSLTIDVNRRYEFNDTLQICSGDTAWIAGFPVTTSDDLVFPFQTEFGCDSIYRFSAIVSNDSIFENKTINICPGDTVLVDGNPIFENAIISEIDTSGSCFKSIETEVILGNNEMSFDTIQTCLGTPIDIFGNTTDQPGDYFEAYSRTDLCDSIHSITLITKDTFYNFETIEICENEEADIFGTPNNIPGIFSKKYAASNGCDSTSYIELIVNDSSLTVENISICETDSIMIFGNFENQEGTYSEVYSKANGCDSTHTIELTKTPIFQINSNTDPSCFGDDSGSASIETSNGNPPFEYNWQNGSTDSLVNNLLPGTYYFTITDQSGCEKQDSVIIQNEEFEFSPDLLDPACFGYSTGSIEILTSNPDLEFSINGIDFTNQPLFDELEAGDYSITVRNSNGCSTETEIELSQPDIFQVSLPNDTLIDLGDSIAINPSLNRLGTDFTWVPDDNLNCPTCPNVIVGPLTQTLYTLFVTDENGCLGQDSITIRVRADRSIFIPDAFSPDNNGINDFFTIYGDNTLAEINELLIFDRWGELIWKGENFAPNVNELGWDGSFRGQPMNSNVFVYYGVLEFIDGVTIEVKGDVTLMR